MTPERQSDPDDIKRKFREALDRKNHRHADSELAQDNADHARGPQPHGPASQQRQFRRKSG